MVDEDRCSELLFFVLKNFAKMDVNAICMLFDSARIFLNHPRLNFDL